MERLRAIGRLKTRVATVSDGLRGASAPTQDKVWFRFRGEQTLLYQMLTYDHSLIAGASQVAELVRALDADTWNADSNVAAHPISEALRALDDTLRQRREMLLVPTM